LNLKSIYYATNLALRIEVEILLLGTKKRLEGKDRPERGTPKKSLCGLAFILLLASTLVIE